MWKAVGRAPPPPMQTGSNCEAVWHCSTQNYNLNFPPVSSFSCMAKRTNLREFKCRAKISFQKEMVNL